MSLNSATCVKLRACFPFPYPVPRPRVLMPAVVAGNAVKVQCILNHLTSQLQTPAGRNPDSDSPDSDSSIPAKRMCLNPSPRDGSSPDAEMAEVSEVASNPSLPVETPEAETLPKQSLTWEYRNIQQTSSSESVSMNENSNETSGDGDNIPIPKRIHFLEPDIAGPVPKLRKPTPFSVSDLIKPSERPQPLPPAAADSGKPSERHQPLPSAEADLGKPSKQPQPLPQAAADRTQAVTPVPVPSTSRLEADRILKIDFDQQLQVVEKEAPSLSKTKAGSTPVPTGDGLQQGAAMTSSFMDEINSSSASYSLDVLLEATLHNSNILHVCCQLEGGGKSEGAGHKGEELEAPDIFRSHAGTCRCIDVHVRDATNTLRLVFLSKSPLSPEYVSLSCLFGFLSKSSPLPKHHFPACLYSSVNHLRYRSITFLPVCIPQ